MNPTNPIGPTPYALRLLPRTMIFNPTNPIDPTPFALRLLPRTMIFNPTTFLLFFILSVVVAISSGCSRQEEYVELAAKIVLPQSDITIKEGETVLFRASAAGGSPPYRYVWNLGLAAPEFSGRSTPEIVFRYEGAYTVVLKVTDARQKQATDEVKIMVTRRETIY